MHVFRKISGARPVVLKCDPALDPEALDARYSEYERSYDEKLLPLRAGERPTVYMIAPLTATQNGHVKDARYGIVVGAGDVQLRIGSASVEAIAYGVHNVRGLMVEAADGKLEELKIERVRGQVGLRLPADVLDMLCANDEIQTELARHVARVTQFSSEVAKSDRS